MRCVHWNDKVLGWLLCQLTSDLSRVQSSSEADINVTCLVFYLLEYVKLCYVNLNYAFVISNVRLQNSYFLY